MFILCNVATYTLRFTNTCHGLQIVSPLRLNAVSFILGFFQPHHAWHIAGAK